MGSSYRAVYSKDFGIKGNIMASFLCLTLESVCIHVYSDWCFSGAECKQEFLCYSIKNAEYLNGSCL